MTRHPSVISVHVPKAGGSSFRLWLESAFGPENVALDYADRPMDPQSEMNVDPEAFLRREATATLPKQVVHGHFWAKKYEHADAVRITFLRCPIARAISNYFFWLATPANGHSLQENFQRSQVSLLEFARYPQISAFYRSTFFRSVDMERFDFIGRTENYQEELERLSALLGKRGEEARVNTNPAPAYDHARQAIQDDLATMSQLRSILSEEIRFYDQHAGT